MKPIIFLFDLVLSNYFYSWFFFIKSILKSFQSTKRISDYRRNPEDVASYKLNPLLILSMFLISRKI